MLNDDKDPYTERATPPDKGDWMSDWSLGKGMSIKPNLKGFEVVDYRGNVKFYLFYDKSDVEKAKEQLANILWTLKKINSLK